MKSVVVTGATSMIGTALINECIRNKVKVFAVVRPNSANIQRLPESDYVTVIECDINDIQMLPQRTDIRADVFYNIAWGFTGARRNDSLENQASNIQMTLNAVKAASGLGCKKFVGAGSQAEYGLLDIDKIAPDSPADPITPYGIAKYAAGKLAMIACRRLGMDCLWPRIFSVYGIYDKPGSMISTTLSKVLKHEPAEFTAGIQRWDYLFSEDAGRAYYLIGEKACGYKVYCVGSGHSAPLREYIEIMLSAAGSDTEPQFGKIPYKSDTVMNLCADISSLTSDTGFVPRLGFEEGIRKTIDWYYKEHK